MPTDPKKKGRTEARVNTDTRRALYIFLCNYCCTYAATLCSPSENVAKAVKYSTHAT